MKNEIHESFIRCKPLVITLAIATILIAVFFFILPQTENTPVTREEAVAVKGNFQKYDSGKNYVGIYLEDGSYYSIFAHTEPTEFHERMETMKPGTHLELLIHPESNYVIGVTANGEELLNSEAIQQSIQRYGYGYIGIGVFICLASVIIVIFSFQYERSEQEEKKRREQRKRAWFDGMDSPILRIADTTRKTRTLLSVSKKGYQIDYRRVGHVNELLINGRVYDEKRAIFEFAHTLSADIDGHCIEAGYDGGEYSFICFDSELIAQRRRLI